VSDEQVDSSGADGSRVAASGLGEHRRGGVDTGDPGSVRGEGRHGTAGSAADFENGVVGLCGEQRDRLVVERGGFVDPEVASEHLPDVDAARAAYLGDADTDEVTREELLARVRAGSATVVDVRPVEEFGAGHIPGAVSIPLDELAGRLAELPADREVVAYCRGAYCVLAHDAVRVLTAQGMRARRLAEGMLEWRLAGLPVAA
jgi:rhodanese-related sulfurtransferase